MMQARGINACDLRLMDLWLPATANEQSKPALPYIYPEFQLQPGQAVHIVPGHLKNVRGANAASIIIHVAEQKIMDPLRWLHAHLTTAAKHSQPVSNYIVRPLAADKHTFQEQAISGPGLHNRFINTLQQLGIHDGETMHSFRRGKAMSMLHTGSSRSSIQEHMIITSPAMLTQHYLPPGRPAPRKRQRTHTT